MRAVLTSGPPKLLLELKVFLENSINRPVGRIVNGQVSTVMCLHILRLDPQRPIVTGDRLFMFFKITVGNTQIVKRLGILRIDR